MWRPLGRHTNCPAVWRTLVRAQGLFGRGRGALWRARTGARGRRSARTEPLGPGPGDEVPYHVLGESRYKLLCRLEEPGMKVTIEQEYCTGDGLAYVKQAGVVPGDLESVVLDAQAQCAGECIH